MYQTPMRAVLLFALTCVAAETDTRWTTRVSSLAPPLGVKQRTISKTPIVVTEDALPGQLCVPTSQAVWNVSDGNTSMIVDTSAMPTVIDVLFQYKMVCIRNITTAGTVSAVAEDGSSIYLFQSGADDAGDYLADTGMILLIGMTTLWIHTEWNKLWYYVLYAALLSLLMLTLVGVRLCTSRKLAVTPLLAALAFSTSLGSTIDRMHNALTLGNSQVALIVFVLCTVIDIPVVLLAATMLRGIPFRVCLGVVTLLVGFVALFALGSGYLFAPVLLMVTALVSLAGDVAVIQCTRA
jgi:hypothetical protein